MARKTLRRTALVGLFLFLVIVGAGVGVWNQQQIQACHQMYDDDPTIIVECEDSFTDIMNGLSLLGLVLGGVGLVSMRFRRGR